MSNKTVDTYESCLKNKSPNPTPRFCRNLFFNSVWCGVCLLSFSEKQGPIKEKTYIWREKHETEILEKVTTIVFVWSILTSK